MPGIQLGDRLVQVERQDPREILRIQVVLDIQHQPLVDPPRPADLDHAGQRRQLQPVTHRRRRRLQARRDHLGRRHPTLGTDHRVKVATLHQVIGQARRRDKPAPTLLAIDQPLGLQLQQGLTHGDPGGTEQLTEFALGGQFATRWQQAVSNLLMQSLTDSCHRLGCLFAHQRYLSGLDQHCLRAQPRRIAVSTCNAQPRQCR